MPGWTLPGVFTVGGAQALLKNQRVLPGRRMVLAGVGPLLLVVASQLSEAGVNVVAVSEPVSPWASLSLLPALVRERSLLADGFRYRGGLLRRRVPWLSRTILTRIEGTEQVRAAVVMRADRDWRPVAGTERRFEVDAVAMGYGLLPSLELPRICGCAVEYDRDRRGWRPTRTEHFESSVPGVFVVGDGAGVAGAVVAVEEGRIAGLAAAHQLGKLSAQETAHRTAAHAERLRRLDLFRRAVDQAFALQDGLFEIDDAATIACRCEEVSFAELVAALDDGADTPAMLKSFTRCGMGPCQGRMCAASTTEWLASRTGQSIEALGLAPAAPPAKPVTTLETLAAS
jgi:NADPH-dependent 2,4-dienoyl-CoA reductase/sulfur reductase-like enzyme